MKKSKILFLFFILIIIMLTSCEQNRTEVCFNKKHCVSKEDGDHTTTICVQSTNESLNKIIVESFEKLV